MDALTAIQTRRSVRKYREGKVSDELINKILEAGMNAPSAGNEQPWHFIVIKDRKILNEIPKFSPYAGMVKQADFAILVCGDIKLEKYEGYWVQDCSAATQNILLSAHALGLGAVWTGVYPREDRVKGFRKQLNIPDDVTPFAFIPVGYPAEETVASDRFRKERVHYERW